MVISSLSIIEAAARGSICSFRLPINTFEPVVRGRMASSAKMSKEIVVKDKILYLAPKGIISVIPFIKFTRDLFSIITPLGFPVEPEV